MACGAPECVEKRKKEAEAKAKAGKNPATGGSSTPPSDLCTAVKNYVSVTVTKQANHYRNNKKFNSALTTQAAPYKNYYSYGYVVIGNYYVLFQAIPLIAGLPVIVGYAYLQGTTKTYVISTLVQVSKTKSNSQLITKDAPVASQLRTESGWSPNCT